MRKSELKAHFKTVCSGSRRSIAVQQFVNADVKQIGKLLKMNLYTVHSRYKRTLKSLQHELERSRHEAK